MHSISSLRMQYNFVICPRDIRISPEDEYRYCTIKRVFFCCASARSEPPSRSESTDLHGPGVQSQRPIRAINRRVCICVCVCVCAVKSEHDTAYLCALKNTNNADLFNQNLLVPTPTHTPMPDTDMQTNARTHMTKETPICKHKVTHELADRKREVVYYRLDDCPPCEMLCEY